MIAKCKFCGNPAPDARKMWGYCQGCYKYFCLDGKKLYDLPDYGKVEYAENGDAICHICGKAFRKLGAHAWNNHHISMRSYCNRYGLFYENTKASNADYRKHMKAVQKDYCITVNLLEKGKQTRLKPGQILRHKREAII